jgi:hypothetical protein
MRVAFGNMHEKRRMSACMCGTCDLGFRVIGFRV